MEYIIPVGISDIPINGVIKSVDTDNGDRLPEAVIPRLGRHCKSYCQKSCIKYTLISIWILCKTFDANL